MKYIDCHTHAQFAAFEKDYKEVIGRALDNNVFLVNVGTQKDTSWRAVDIAHEFPSGVYATVGVHPIHVHASFHDEQELGVSRTDAEVNADSRGSGFTSRAEEFDYEYYKKLAMDDRVVAVGECGLDYYRIEDLGLRIKEKQREVFVKHIELAYEVKKPLMIHCRDAYEDLCETLISNSKFLISNPGIVHFFRGTKEDARKLLDMGFYFTFGGVITFVRDYDEIVKCIPMDRILSETDAPYVTPAPYRGKSFGGTQGKRNEPAYVIEVVKKLAELKGVSVEDVKDKIWENARRVFDFLS
ncbi:hypothetical protein A3A21_02350 [Candidatus Jorgensenbacteria bacterium RIFCSPLOWO2_01_FULL_45_25b]|uniref:Hydrolase TatD n=1 Tax=Candidatus Jorgensenbacteria bacterium RIFCSPLOWO2_01_FULL_45_25b TaxID=1798471 RepID=A0A1F6BS55_9BACT|nr:MAG: hypothetical protein A3A21_02350 [Candidatus Jorgensenbacteria bacterium RIFCSPLOWO2_01_FULL_45_25b]